MGTGDRTLFGASVKIKLGRYNYEKLAGTIVLVLALSLQAEEPHQNTPVVKVVRLDKTDQAIDTTAPPSQFIVPDGEEVWKRAFARAANPVPGNAGGFFDASQLISDDFRSAKSFHSERFAEGEEGNELQMVIAADEAIREGDQLFLTRMRMIYFLTGADTSMGGHPGKVKRRTPAHGPAPTPASTEPSHPSPSPSRPPRQSRQSLESPPKASVPSAAPNVFLDGRMIVTAPKATINLVTNEGFATGNVTIEIFAVSSPKKPLIVLSSERLHWRSWNEPTTGSIELALYTYAEHPGESDPYVIGTYDMPGLDGGPSSFIEIKGHGMIFESGTYEPREGTKSKGTPVPDEDGRMAGLSRVARNRAIFHNGIVMESTAATMSSLFQMNNGPGAAPAPAAAPVPVPVPKAHPADAAPPSLSRTIISCQGPAVLDMAVVPRKIDSNPALQPMLLARRFDFLNQVHLKKFSLDAPVAGRPAEIPTEMSCGHLRFEYPPGSMPSPTTLPQFAEALGGVHMSGSNAAPANAAGNQAVAMPAGPFNIDCERMYHDGQTDNMFMVGTAQKLAHVKNADGEAFAQQFDYRRKTQTMTMPSTGPKKLLIRSNDSGTVKPEGAPVEYTTITWYGLLTREMRHLPVPRGSDLVKEVLTFHDNVYIEQPNDGLKMHGQSIQIVKNADDVVEFLEGHGMVSMGMGGNQKAVGEIVTVQTLFNGKGEVLLSKDPVPTALSRITVIGAQDAKATLLKGGSELRANKFIIDEGADTFEAFGGTVAYIPASPPPPPLPGAPKPPVKKPDSPSGGGGGMVKSMNFDPNGEQFIQCDGEFSKDGATHRVVIKENVLIIQPGLQLLADEVYITMEDPPAPPPGTVAPATDSLLPGEMKSLECRGVVDIITDEQWVQCDRLFLDVAADRKTLLVDDPENDVRVYMHDEAGGGTKILSVQKSLDIDGKTGVYKPGGVMLILPYLEKVPTLRDKNRSPVRRKAATTQKTP